MTGFDLLIDLFYSFRSHFYNLDTNDYFDAMSELNDLTKQLGYTLNDLAKAIIVE